MIKQLRTLLLVSIALAFAQTGYAQYNPNLQFNAGNPRGLNTTSDTATIGWLAITAGGETTNGWSAVQALPFGFSFYGSAVTNFKVSRNGLLTFNTGTAVLPNANADLPTNLLPDKTIASFWDAFSAAPPLPPNSRIYTRVFGTAGSRQLWVKWTNYEIGNPVCAFANFACVLEEGTNKIYMVDMNYSSAANVTATIGLQNTSSQAIQFGSSTFGFFSTNSGPAVADNDYYEFTPQITSDAGVLSIDAPTVPFGSGTSNVVVTLKNFSQSTLSNVTVKWRVNNVTQPDFVFNGSIAANATLSNVVIGSFNFVDGATYVIEAETDNPNSTSDINPANDKATKSVCPMLLGNYTIGGISGRFNTINEAVNMLQCAGVETAVRFTLSPGAGPFNETISINPISGASGKNTITFDGGITNEKVTSTGAYTFRLNGADHIILQNLTIENLSPTTGSSVLLVSQADSNIIRNNFFPLKPSTGTANAFVGVVIGTTAFTGTPNNGSFNQILNNEFDGGLAGVVMRANATGLDQRNIVRNNVITNANSQGVLSVYQKMPFIQQNTIVFATGNTSSTGVQSENNDNFEISRNFIRNYGSRGIYITNGNNISGGVNSRAKVVNNMLISAQGGFGDGISFGSNSSFVDIHHNSVSVNGGSGDGMFITQGSSISVKNNSFAIFDQTSTFNRAFYGGTNVTYAAFDHNNFFISGSGAVVRVNNQDLGQANFIGFGGFNTNSHFGDPGYLSRTSDLHAITTQLDNKGDNAVGVMIDIDGQVRPALPGGQVDIGADEFIIFPTDIAVTDMIAPSQNGRVLTSKSLSATQDITIRVTNSGGSILTNIPVFYKINGVASAQELVPGPLNPGTSTTFTFASKANLSAIGTYNIAAFSAVTNDSDRSNDTLATIQIKQLSNAPVTFPVMEDFEATPSLTLARTFVGLPGAERFDYETSSEQGRLRTFAGTGFAKSGLKAITFDRLGTGTGRPINFLIATLNLAGFTTTDVMMLDFAYAFHSNFGNDDPNNRVWVRGNDNAAWVEVYNLFANKLGAGNYKPVTNINLSAALAAAGQTYSSSTQIRFGQSSTGRATSNTCCDGFSFDDIAVRKLLQTDLGVTALVQPVANACGDSIQSVSVTVKNFGVASRSNIPVVVNVSGAVNTTLTGTVPGPISTDQSVTFQLGTLNTYTGGTFNFKAYTNMALDEDRRNDTLKTTLFLNSIPVKPMALTATTCEGEPANLQVTGTADSYNFYANNTTNVILGNSVSGNFVTQPLTATTTFYASSVNSTPAEVGPKDQSFGVGGSVNQFEAGLEFNVSRALILDSVFVYPASAGNVRINLLNAAGVVIATKTVAVTTPNVKTPIPLGFRIPAGNNYKLNATGSTVTALFRNTNNATFPYQIPQALSIIGGTFGTGPFYYFFYDWQVTVLECESRRVAVTAVVNPKPVVNLGADIRNCTGSAVTLNAGNAGLGFAYQWSNGAAAQTISAATSGQYWVKVTNPITGCFKFDTINVFIGTAPVVNLGADVVQCGGVVTLNAGNAGNNFDYSWSNGSATQTIGVTASGTYSVTVTNPATGCSTTDQIQVTINAIPTVSLGADRTQCGGSVTLDAGNTGSGYNYLWNTGATTRTITAATSGQYWARVTNPAGNCFSADTLNVTINAIPVVNVTASGPITFCQGDSVTLTASGGGTFLWSNGANTQAIKVKAAGTYSVTVTNAANCSATSTATTVTVNPKPVVTLANQSICAGQPATLTVPAQTGVTYSWSSGQTGNSITVSPTANTTYTVTATGAGGCATTGQATVTVSAAPTVNAGLDTTICSGAPVTLTATGSGTVFNWSNGMSGSSITVSPTTTTTYTVTAGPNANNCSATDAVVVTVLPTPALPVISAAGSVLSSSVATGNQWYLNGTLIPGATGQNYTPAAGGNYTVTATIGTCSRTSAALLFTMVGISDDLLANQLSIYPNPTSGKFEVKLTGMNKPATLSLYSLTGQLLTKVEVKQSQGKTLEHTFDLTSYAQGIYLLKLETDGKVAFRKIARE